MLARRLNSSGGVEYLIRWRGFDSSWDTWEPAENLGSAQEAVDEFNRDSPPAMASSRPARVIKTPSKFLDADLPLAINGIDVTSGPTVSGKLLARSLSLPREDNKAKTSPKRRSSTAEMSQDEDTKSTGRLSRQSSASPPAKVKTPRKSDAEAVTPMNGEQVVSDKEQPPSTIKLNNTLSKVKLSSGSSGNVSHPSDTVPLKPKGKEGSEGPDSTSKSIRRKLEIEEKDDSFMEPKVLRGNVTEPGKKLGKKAGSNTKKSDAGDKQKDSHNSTSTKDGKLPARRKKSESHVNDSAATHNSPKESRNAANTTTKLKTAAKRTVSLKTAKLSTKPGKGVKVWRFRSKASKLKSPFSAKTDSKTKRTFPVSRLNSRSQPRRLKLSADSGKVKAEGSSGLGDVSARERKVRYKKDGTPCLKPGPKPKKLSSCDDSGSTLNQDVSENSQPVAAKGKAAPKAQKVIHDEVTPDKGKLAKSKKPLEASESAVSSESLRESEADALEKTARKKGAKPKKIENSPKIGETDSTRKKEETSKTKSKAKQASVPKVTEKSSALLKTNGDIASADTQTGAKVKSKVTTKKKLAEATPKTGGKDNPKESKKNVPEAIKLDTSQKKVSTGSTASSTSSPAKGTSKTKNVKVQSTKSENESTQKDSTKSKVGAKTVSKQSPNAGVGKTTAKPQKTNHSSSPPKVKGAQKMKKASSENSSKSKSTIQVKNDSETSKQQGKKAKKGVKRPILNSAGRQNSSSDDSDTLYSLNDEPGKKKLKLDPSDSATSSDSEVVLKKPKATKLDTPSPSPRKMLLKDSIRPKMLDNDTGTFCRMFCVACNAFTELTHPC